MLRTAESLVCSTDELKRQIEKFVEVFCTWFPQRNESIALIRTIGTKIDKVHKQANISNAVGGSAAVVGGGMAVAGICLTPVTLGTSAIALTGGGLVLGAAGSMTGVGATIADLVIRGKNKKQAMTLLNADREQTLLLARIAERIQQLMEAVEAAAVFIKEQHNAQQRIASLNGEVDSSRHQPTNPPDRQIVSGNSPAADVLEFVKMVLPKYFPSVLPDNLQPTKVLKSLTWLSGKVYRNAKFVENFKTVIVQGGKSATTGRTLVSGAGAIFVGIGIALELVNIGITARDLHLGSKTKTAQELFTVADQLEIELVTAKDFFDVIIDID